MSINEARRAIKEDGFHILPRILTDDLRNLIVREIEQILATPSESSVAVRSRKGRIYGARNIAPLWAQIRVPLRETPILDILHGLLGPTAGLVRALYLDKPPGRSWGVPWHKDLNIAVKNNTRKSSDFTHPTTKSGVPHIEAPPYVLSNMLFVRLHLDPVTEANGPLVVIPGSHKSGKKIETTGPHRTLLHDAGDVLFIRPLLAHRSGRSNDESAGHRRVLHLEFAGSHRLPDGFAWHSHLAL